MKKTIYLLTIGVLFVLVLDSCKKEDPCENVPCLNGGTCIDGECLCTNGYTGVNCQIAPDPCADITCLNGGTCANGLCVCTQGYTGANCSQQATPSQIRITNIEVTRFPATDGGAGWDLTSGPDIFITLYLGSTIVWDSPNYIENANPSLNYQFTPNPAIVLSNPNSQYTIWLFDYDFPDPDDQMGGINFTPYCSTCGFPPNLTIDGGGSVAFRLSLTYIW
ncbi:MAG: calcium-binding EGF-like domain-containing protein [Sphingobacteriales bacterium]|nr:MAG: calcium-binding EGF-like domain-containing protein [Sphingobacteriales bacterium]